MIIKKFNYCTKIPIITPFNDFKLDTRKTNVPNTCTK